MSQVANVFTQGPAPANVAANQKLTASDVYGRVESCIEDLEASFGPRSLAHFVDSYYSLSERRDFIEQYRLIIRDNHWHHGSALELSHQEFLSEFLAVSLEYAHSAFFALNYLAGKTRIPLVEAHRRSWAAEALRGQVGKRSPWGLDARLEEAERGLAEQLARVPDCDVEEGLYLLCTPTAPPLSAETSLVQDFLALRSLVPEPTAETRLEHLEVAAERVVRRFLRRHCRWSPNEMERWYSDFKDLSAEHEEHMRSGRIALAAERSGLLLHIARAADRETSMMVDRMSTEIAELNQLNLAVEPSFSFKGGVGLAHWGVFARAQRTSAADSVHLRQLDLEKAPVSRRHLTTGIRRHEEGRT